MQAKRKTFTGWPDPSRKSRNWAYLRSHNRTAPPSFQAGADHSLSAEPPPRVHAPTIHPTADNPGGLQQASKTLHRSHVLKIVLASNPDANCYSAVRHRTATCWNESHPPTRLRSTDRFGSVSSGRNLPPPLCPQDPKRSFKRPALLVPKKTSGIVQSGNA